MTTSDTFDFAIIGGGVIGLSIAWQLSKSGTVVVLDRNRVGREASWAGAGILPPSSVEKAVHPIERLSAESFVLHEQWANRLASLTGIDTGYRKCGALFVARTPGEAAALSGQCMEWSENGVNVVPLSSHAVVECVPALAAVRDRIRSAVFVTDESQIRNPDHLRALVTACKKSGVQFLEELGNCELNVANHSVTGIQVPQRNQIVAGRYCLAAGAWTKEISAHIGIQLSTLPVRGQILLFKLPQRTFKPILYEGTRYLVPRDDGHVVVGSTLEEAGFDKSTTSEGLHELMEFASGLVPELNHQSLVDSWAGLRPASFDGFPYMGPASRIDNLWVATGHFRSGLLLSTATAVIMSQLMCGDEPLFDVSPFRVDRG